MGDVHIKNFPEDVKERIKVAAAMRGITMAEFVIAALEQAAKAAIDEYGAAGGRTAKTEVITTNRTKKK